MKKGNFLIIIGLLLIAAAISLTGYNLRVNHRAEVESQHALEQLLPEIKKDPVPKEGRFLPNSKTEIEYPDYVINPQMDMPVMNVDGKDMVGVLSIPAIEIELPVCSEWSYANLNSAPCRYSGTVYLDNMIICAHNFDIHFGSIKYLSYGDTVTFTDMDGNVFNYQVMEIVTLQPTAIEEMTTGEWDLTLFTCTIGGATRVTVRCEKTET